MLELLVAVDSHGSIGAGARAVGITQPAASATIRGLERRLGLDLLVRSPRGSVLTDDGAAVATWAKEVIAASDRFENAVATLRGGSENRVRIAASMTIAEYLVPRWLPRLADQRVELVVRNSRDVMDLVVTADVALGFIEGTTLRRGLRSRTIAHDRLVVVVGADHPWAAGQVRAGAGGSGTIHGRAAAKSVDELLDAQLVVREQGSGTREVLERALASAGRSLPPRVPHLGSTSAIVTAVRYGGAVAVLSALAVADELAQGSLVEVRISDLDLDRRLRMVWKDGGGLAGPARHVAAVARDGRNPGMAHPQEDAG